MRHGGSIPVAVAPKNGRATPKTIANACGFRGPTLIAMRDLVFPLQCLLFQSNGVVSRPIRTRERIETDRYPFRHKAARDIRAGERL